MYHFLFLKKRRLGGINSKKDTKIKKNIAAGGIVPDKGLKEKPVLKSSISNKKNTYKDK